MKKLIISAIIAFGPTFALAHGDVLDVVQESVAASFSLFSKDEPAAIKKAFTGVKAWPSGSKVMVKVYLKDMDAMSYSCEMDHSGGNDEVVCQKEVQQ